MDWLLAVKAVILGLVEGFTEFLPISSTGHLILAGALLDFTGDKAATFEIAIQTGAMFAVVWEYRERIGATLAGIATDRRAQRFALQRADRLRAGGGARPDLRRTHQVAPVPSGAGGDRLRRRRLHHPLGRARHRRDFGPRETAPTHRARIESVDDMSALDALKVGLAQCAALIPGTSRSGATIIGGMLFGMSRTAATEFSFYLGDPDAGRRRRLLGVEAARRRSAATTCRCSRSAASWRSSRRSPASAG